MKKTRFFALVLVFSVLFSVLCFTSCSTNTLYSEGEGKIQILCTVFAPFDFARVVGGDRVTVTILQDNGSDLHNYTPTGATLEALSNADLLIHIGGVSDQAWLSDAIRAAGNEDLRIVCLMDHIVPIHAELAENWSDHDSHGADESHDEHNEHGHDHSGHDHGADEHIWTSLRNSVDCVLEICHAISDLDPDNADYYKANADAYVAALQQLDRQYAEVAESFFAPVIFADRFPFVYLMHDYHLSYSAAFSGCSTEVDSSFEMQIRLIKAVRELAIPCVFTIEGNDKSLAEAISAETGCKIVSLNSLQSVKRADIKNGITYLSVMEKNLNALKEVSQWP